MGRRLSDKWVSQRGSPRQANNAFEPELRGIRSDTAAEMAAGAGGDGGAPTAGEHSTDALQVTEMRSARLLSHSGARSDAVQDVAAGAPNPVSWGDNEEHAQQVSNPIAAPSSQRALGTTAARHAEI